MNLNNSSRATVESVCPVQPGEVIAGKYRVDRVVGAGGMGVVVAATHLQLHHLVAIKLLAPRFATYELAMPRFLQEACAAARIQNEHVVRVFDVGVLPDGPPYIAMEYLDGVDSDRLIDQRGSLPLQEAIECLLQACEGIAEAHAVGVVHRDLKPGNLVRCEHPGAPPLVKVVDFGVSKLRDAQLPSLVVTGPARLSALHCTRRPSSWTPPATWTSAPTSGPSEPSGTPCWPEGLPSPRSPSPSSACRSRRRDPRPWARCATTYPRSSQG